MSEDTSTTTPEGGTTPTGADKTFTQADVDRIVAERLRRERERFSDYDALKAKAAEADSSKSDLQKLNDRIASAEKRAADAEAKQLRTEVAQAKGLSAAQARRLAGSTKEELEADADDLLEAFGGKKTDSEAPREEPEENPADGKEQRGRPRERLRPGASPEAESEPDAAKIAQSILSSPF